jgi:hypothetical protein
MRTRHRRARALGVVANALLVGPADAATSAPPAPLATGQTVTACAEPIGHGQCLKGCTPANLIFLPCMAVGAQVMAACREREVALCIETCRRRFC